MKIDRNVTYCVNDYTFTNFVNLEKDMVEQIWSWRNDQNIRKYMYNREIIPLDNHLSFVQSLNKRNDVAYWLVRKGKTPIGVTNLTDINLKKSSAELGYYMIPIMLNSGLGLEFAYNNLLFAFDAQIGCNYIHGAIHRLNINALMLDSYLGCKIKMEDFEQPENEFISFNVSKDDFFTNAFGKNDMHAFIAYVKTHRKDFQF